MGVQPGVVQLLESIVKRLERLESGRDRQQPVKTKDEQKRRGPVVCFRFGQEDHLARGCASGRRKQGN